MQKLGKLKHWKSQDFIEIVGNYLILAILIKSNAIELIFDLPLFFFFFFICLELILR